MKTLKSSEEVLDDKKLVELVAFNLAKIGSYATSEIWRDESPSYRDKQRSNARELLTLMFDCGIAKLIINEGKIDNAVDGLITRPASAAYEIDSDV